jgi:hypothetical protein
MSLSAEIDPYHGTIISITATQTSPVGDGFRLARGVVFDQILIEMRKFQDSI